MSLPALPLHQKQDTRPGVPGAATKSTHLPSLHKKDRRKKSIARANSKQHKDDEQKENVDVVSFFLPFRNKIIMLSVKIH